MDELQFKRLNKPASCSSPPWSVFIPVRDRPEVLRQIRQECIDLYGYAFDECPKRLTCFTKECMGRPLPWLSETARPYLDQLKETQPDNFRGDEYVIKTDCSSCPLAQFCKSPCNQVIDFLERSKVVEPALDYKEVTDNLKIVKEEYEEGTFYVSGKDIPWDILPKRKQEVIKKYLYENRDFRYVGETLGLTNQARAKYEFYSAITKLSEYAVVRAFLTIHRPELTKRQRQIFDMVYYDNRSFIRVAKDLSISKQSVQQTVARVLKKYNVTWKTYVKKRGNKVLYNVPELFK